MEMVAGLAAVLVSIVMRFPDVPVAFNVVTV